MKRRAIALTYQFEAARSRWLWGIMVLVDGVFFMLLVVGCVLCTSDGWLIPVVLHCLSVGYFCLFFIIGEVQSQIFYILRF